MNTPSPAIRNAIQFAIGIKVRNLNYDHVQAYYTTVDTVEVEQLIYRAEDAWTHGTEIDRTPVRLESLLFAMFVLVTGNDDDSVAEFRRMQTMLSTIPTVD